MIERRAVGSEWGGLVMDRQIDIIVKSCARAGSALSKSMCKDVDVTQHYEPYASFPIH